jgi:hypothetical protein
MARGWQDRKRLKGGKLMSFYTTFKNGKVLFHNISVGFSRIDIKRRGDAVRFPCLFS